MIKLRHIKVIGTAIFLSSCLNNVEDPEAVSIDPNKASFTLIQETIFTPTCATSGCHASKLDASFKQHGLVLEKSVAYANLVNMLATNSDAKAAGKKLVEIGNPSNSFLINKICNDITICGKSYGSTMPLGGNPLSVGQVEFIRQWIKNGASKDGKIADIKLLDPTAKINDDWATPPPLPKSAGFQMRIPKFPIAPNTNREFFIRQEVGNNEAIYITSFETLMRAGSHHLLAYNFNNKKNLPPLGRLRDIRYYNNDGTRYANIFSQMALSQYVMLSPGGTEFKYTMPDGYALEIEANASFDLNAHYFNTTNEVKFGEVVLNMYTTPKSEVKKICKPLDLYNYDIKIPAKTRKTETMDFKFETDVEIVSLTSHAHARMERFEIQIVGGKRNGETLLVETNYEHPQVLNFAKPIELKKGEGLRSIVTFNNTTNRELVFGLTTEDEMDIIFGYYVEKK
ncbi:MAG: hypothetical protein K9I84_10190 [Leadbetterella sp.]|nr:hypothetical protein [Leadbetterella sp.]